MNERQVTSQTRGLFFFFRFVPSAEWGWRIDWSCVALVVRDEMSRWMWSSVLDIRWRFTSTRERESEKKETSTHYSNGIERVFSRHVAFRRPELDSNPLPLFDFSSYFVSFCCSRVQGNNSDNGKSSKSGICEGSSSHFHIPPFSTSFSPV